MGRSRFCVSSPLLTLRPLIKISLLQIRKRSLYIIGVPLTRCGNSSLLPFLNASSFSSSDEILAIKRGDLHLFLVSRFFFFCGRISLFLLSGRRNLLVEVKNIVWKILVNAFFFISRIYAVHVFLSLAYSLINTPIFVLYCCLVLIFYITYKLVGDVLNGKMGDYVEILFIFVRWSVYSGIYRTVSLTGFYSEKKCIKASRDRDFAEDCGLKLLSWSLFEAFC